MAVYDGSDGQPHLLLDGGFTSDDATKELRSKLSGLRLASMPESADEVLTRCKSLLRELQIFADYCEKKKYNGDYRQRPEYNHFRGDIEQEVKQMEKVI
jgi:hypothetical protein